MKEELFQSELVKQVEEHQIDLHELMDIHQMIKQKCIGGETETDIASMWAQTGTYVRKYTGDNRIFEISMFMAHLYNRSNFDYLDGLIEAYSANEKYREAIEFLTKLYALAEDSNFTRFWERLTSILPIGRLMVYVHTKQDNILDLFIQDLTLDAENSMTWMTLGYTLKYLDFPILANQALDNAIALQYSR